MNIVFVEPAFPQNQRRFVAALSGVGARVVGVGESPEHELGDELRGQMAAYYQVRNVTDVHQLDEAVQWAQDKMWIDRLESTIESHQMAAAEVREARGIPGTTLRTTWLCRDKPSMKDALRKAGVPTAASTAADSAAEVRAFAQENGFPLILKPRSGAGAQGTVRVDSMADVDRALGDFGGADSIAVEEFVEGHEGFYDTITVDGHIVHDWATHYYPNVLEAMRHRWISPQFITTNRISGSAFYDEVRAMGHRVIEALGITTSATHMEWFYGPKGLRFSEIGCRPPGVGAWDLYSAANDVDVYREWAHAIVHGGPENADDAQVRRRHRRPPPRPRRPHPRLQRPRRRQLAVRRLDHRRAPARHRYGDPAGRGGLHGERVGAAAPPRLRHRTLDARRRRTHASGSTPADRSQ